MHTFKPGDVAIIIHPKSRHYLEECVIESGLLSGFLMDIDGSRLESNYYRVSFGGISTCACANGLPYSYPPQYLRPKPPKQNDLTTWTEVSKVCGWRPTATDIMSKKAILQGVLEMVSPFLGQGSRFAHRVHGFMPFQGKAQ